MPPTFLLVFGVIVLGLFGLVMAAGLLVASLMPAQRASALPALRAGGVGALVGVAVDLVLHLFADAGLRIVRPGEILVAAGAGFALGVIARAVRTLATLPEPEPAGPAPQSGREPVSGPPRVEVRADGITLWNGETAVAAVAWAQVNRIATFKRDNYVTDEVMLALEYAGPDGQMMTLQLSEEWPGFQDLFGVLEERFPGLSPEWYMRVMTPAFDPSFTILYERPAPAPR